MVAVVIESFGEVREGMDSWGGRAGVVALDDGPDKRGHVWVFDFGLLAGVSPALRGSDEDVIVLRRGTSCVGLGVSELHGVARFDRGDCGLVRQIIKANGGDCMIEQAQAA